MIKRSLEIKRVFISGGSRGIGRATVETFAEAGYQVAFTYAQKKSIASELVKKFPSGQLKAIQMDLQFQTSIEAAISEAKSFCEKIDIVIHNAAFTQDSILFTMNYEQWQSVIQASLNSFFFLNKAFLQDMIENRWGRIITLASVSGESGNRGQANYAAAKGALISATKSVAKEYARKGVLANVVSPGIIDTEMIKDLPPLDIKKMIPVGRTGTPQEVANAVYFLASEQASFINGTILQVNGGMYT